MAPPTGPRNWTLPLQQLPHNPSSLTSPLQQILLSSSLSNWRFSAPFHFSPPSSLMHSPPGTATAFPPFEHFCKAFQTEKLCCRTKLCTLKWTAELRTAPQGKLLTSTNGEATAVGADGFRIQHLFWREKKISFWLERYKVKELLQTAHKGSTARPRAQSCFPHSSEPPGCSQAGFTVLSLASNHQNQDLKI